MFTMDEQEEVPPPQRITSMSRDDRIAEFLRLDARIKELSYERREHASALTEIAADERNGRKTVHLQASDGSRILVDFKTDYECDNEELGAVKELLKDEKFDEIFKTTYVPRVIKLRSFLNTVFSDEAWETAKTLIKQSVKEVEKTPYVSVEKSR